MKANQATYPVRVMGRLLGVSASGFYAWKNRPPSKRALQDLALTAKIHAIHRRSGEAYGAPSIHAELADDHAIRVGCKRVARLMRAAGLKGLKPPSFVTTTVADAAADRALDKVDRQFKADGPDRLWVADITYVPTWSGFLYLAIVLDVWSRRIVGWAMANHLKTELVLNALDMALAQRRPSGNAVARLESSHTFSCTCGNIFLAQAEEDVEVCEASEVSGYNAHTNNFLLRPGSIQSRYIFSQPAWTTSRFRILPVDDVVPSAQEGPIETSAERWDATRSMCGTSYTSQINFDWRSGSTFNIRFEYSTGLSPCGVATIVTPPANPELVQIRCLDSVTTAHEIGHILGFKHRNVSGDLMRPAVSADMDVRAYHIRTMLEKYF